MASYIGKSISLISQSDIRYRGILHNVDPVQQTIQLSNVFSMGTENRRPVTEYIPAHPYPYDFILFRAPEVKDISVETNTVQPPPVNNVQNDPAIIGVSQGSGPPQGYESYAFGANPTLNVPSAPGPVPAPIPVQSAVPSAVPPAAPIPAPVTAPAHPSAQATQPPQSHKRRETNGRQSNTNTIRTALQSVERAMGDLRVEAARNGKRGGDTQPGNLQAFTTDFDFETSNAKFNKATLVEESDSDSESDADTNPSNTGDKKDKEKKTKEPAYNPSKSFFDALTPNSLPARGGGAGGQGRGGGRGGRGRGGYGRSRREEEAQRNLMTFGEAMPPAQPSWTGRRGARRGSGPGGVGTSGRGGLANGRTREMSFVAVA